MAKTKGPLAGVEEVLRKKATVTVAQRLKMSNEVRRKRYDILI